MLPTFVIGLREGLEAALIVGMVAAFCVRSGRRDALRWIAVGVSAAVLLCAAVGVALELVQRDLPQRQQEGLETVIGIVAVAMVTYMVVWMRRHSRELSHDLESAAGSALAAGSVTALVAMSFLAVLREGFETAVFTIAAFNSTQNRAASAGGLLLGLGVAAALGYGIYRGGVRINLSKFFRVTGVVLVLVAAGLVMSALHTAHEAGWLNIGQGSTIDLSWLVEGGSVRAALLTGMLGLQPHPVVIELAGWLLYVIPLGLYIAWPPKRPAPWRAVSVLAGVAAAAAAVAAIVLALAAPAGPPARTGMPAQFAGTFQATDPVTRVAADPVPAQANALSAVQVGDATLTLPAPDIRFDRDVRSEAQTIDGIQLSPVGPSQRDGVPVLVFSATQSIRVQDGALGDLPRTITLDQLRGAGGRLPLGISAATVADPLPLVYSDVLSWTFTVEPDSGDIVDVALHLVRTAGAQAGSTVVTLSTVQDLAIAGTDDAVAAAVQQAAADAAAARDAHQRGVVLPWTFGVIAVLLGLLSAAAGVAAARRARSSRAAGAVPSGAAAPAPLASSAR